VDFVGEAVVEVEDPPVHGNPVMQLLARSLGKAVILADGDRLKSNDFVFFENDVIVMNETETLEEMERKMIISTLKKNNFNQMMTAEQLGITRQTLYNKLKKYGI